MSSSIGSKFLRWLRVHVFVRACVRTRRLPWSPACFAPVHLRSFLLSLACVFLTACLLHCYTPLFDSNIFASYMLGLDARELADKLIVREPPPLLALPAAPRPLPARPCPVAPRLARLAVELGLARQPVRDHAAADQRRARL